MNSSLLSRETESKNPASRSTSAGSPQYGQVNSGPWVLIWGGVDHRSALASSRPLSHPPGSESRLSTGKACTPPTRRRERAPDPTAHTPRRRKGCCPLGRRSAFRCWWSAGRCLLRTRESGRRTTVPACSRPNSHSAAPQRPRFQPQLRSNYSPAGGS